VLDARKMRQRREKRDEAYGETTSQQNSESGERSIDANVELREVETALEDLSERTLMVFRKARIEGYTQKEIAAELEISVSGVEKHLLKAYARIAELRTRQTEDLPS